MHPEKETPHKMSRPFLHKKYYEGETNEQNHNTDDSRFENGDYVKNLGKEQGYKEDDELK